MALLNIAKWQGRRATYSQLNDYAKKCNCIAGIGTDRVDLSKFIGKRAIHTTYQRFKKHILSGGAVIIIGWSKDRPNLGHIFIVTDVVRYKNELYFWAVNFSSKAKFSRLHWRYMQEYLLDSMVWTVNKNDYFCRKKKK